MMPAPMQSPDTLRTQLQLASEQLWQLTHQLGAHTAPSEIEQLAIAFDGARRTALMLGAAMPPPVPQGVTL
jgi:hypothetical protein